MSGATPRIACHHCGEPVDEPGRWTATVGGAQRDLCCAGCQAVAQAIVAAGFEDYYRARSAPAERGAAALPAGAQALRLWDDEDVQARYVQPRDSDREATLLIEGLRCGACVWLLEQTLRSRAGVVQASVNLATERATLRWDPSKTRLSALLEAISRVGYRAQPFDAREREAQWQRASKALFRRLFVATLAMMQVMMYAFPAYIAAPGDMEPAHESLMRWASLLLTIPVVLYSASPFFAGAWRDLRARSAGMDVPVVIGIVAAFAASVHATVAGRGEVYFDSVTMFVCLLLAARYVEWIARRRAGRAIDALAAAAPDSAERLGADGGIERVPATRLRPGDLLRVAAGERIAVDARIVEGRTSIDLSLLTGEAIPVSREPGDEVPGGAINAGSPIVASVLRGSAASAISTIERLVDRAAAEKPRLAGVAERVARVFVAFLLLLSLVVWLAWLQVDPARAATVAIAVLVVSCPCALSMAMPAALAAATGAAVRRGMLVARGDALEHIAECTDVVFDKTGTLTRGRPEVVRVVPLGALQARLEGAASQEALARHALAIAAALEAGQSHPLAEAIRRAASPAELPASSPARSPASSSAGIPQVAADEPAQAAPGLGVEGRIAGRRYRLGTRRFVLEPLALRSGEAAASEDSDADTHVWLADDDGLVARIDCRDGLRDEARTVVDALAAAGLGVHLVSGDRRACVEAIARELGLADAHGNARPDDKLAFVRELQARGRRVLMVGDGINDAPVLAAADVSVAVGDASSLARTAASVVLLGASIDALPALRGLALRTRAIVRQNLGWALAYNAIAIPAAALGWVPPWLAALGMSTSSLLVVLNALRLIPPARTRASASAARATPGVTKPSARAA